MVASSIHAQDVTTFNLSESPSAEQGSTVALDPSSQSYRFPTSNAEEEGSAKPSLPSPSNSTSPIN